MKRWLLIVMGVALALGVAACAYFAARFNLQSFREAAAGCGVSVSAEGFHPAGAGTVYRDAILHVQGHHELFIRAPVIRTRGWWVPEEARLEGASFHFFGPWYSIPTGTVEEAVFRDDGGVIRFTCSLRAAELLLDHRALYNHTVPLRDIRIRLSGYLDPGGGVASIEEGTLESGTLRVAFKLAQRLGPGPAHADLSARLDDARADDLAASLFRLPLLRLGTPGLAGTFSAALTLRVDEEKPETTSAKVQFRNDLSLVRLSEAYDAQRLKGTFSWDAYDPSGGSVKRTSGPGTPDWLAVTSAPPHLAAAVIMAVDPQFAEHNGLSDLAASAALTDHLKQRRRSGGYETIGQRVAGLLWPVDAPAFTRAMALGLLAGHLHASLAREDILALFLNIAPWGQSRYGARRAAWEFFGKHPHELAVEESALIAASLASPRRVFLDQAGAARPEAVADVLDLLAALERGGLLGKEPYARAVAEVQQPGWPLRVTRPGGARPPPPHRP